MNAENKFVASSAPERWGLVQGSQLLVLRVPRFSPFASNGTLNVLLLGRVFMKENTPGQKTSGDQLAGPQLPKERKLNLHDRQTMYDEKGTPQETSSSE